ncbi:MAG: D-alanyl-D-alanine carboxypeptidase/D-alanyl-D-alanine-endopeptidase [Actinomycetes bacterium]
MPFSLPYARASHREGVEMPRARWWVIGALSVVTFGVIVLDTTGVIFDDSSGSEDLVVPPPLVLPVLPDAELALPPAVEPLPAPPDRPRVRQVERALDAEALGPSVHALVAPLAEPSSPWLEIDADELATPASTIKLWTATAALDGYSPQGRLETAAVWDAKASRLVLVGGGDATLTTEPVKGQSTASLATLTRSTVRALRQDGVSTVRLAYDSTLFSGPAEARSWEPTYVSSGVIAPVTALMVDQGRASTDGTALLSDPAVGAAEQFAEQLSAAGITVRGKLAKAKAPDVQPLATVSSPPMADLVERMLRDSDNQLAEALGRMAAVAQGEPGSFAGVSTALKQAGAKRDVNLGNAEINDASGLARDDTIPASSLVAALHAASIEPELAPILSGLSVAGFNGTLAERFSAGPAAEGAGVVRAKTGTLTGISAEAGVVTTCDGDLVAFAFVADEVADTDAARKALDDAAAALATCPKRL